MIQRKPSLVARRPQPASVKPGSKIPISDLGSRAIATTPEPGIKVGSGNEQSRADLYTYFTKPTPIGDTVVLYDANRTWTDVTLTLETAGPVAVGIRSSITPVLSGKGILLTTDQPQTFRIAKGSKLYIAATSVNRVKVLLQPVPWLEQITGLLGDAVRALSPLASLSSLVRR